MMKDQIQLTYKASKLLSCKTRLLILAELSAQPQGRCVNDLAERIHMSHSATSHQLAALEKAGVVACTRDGQTMCYTLTPSPLTTLIQHILSNPHRTTQTAP